MATESGAPVPAHKDEAGFDQEAFVEPTHNDEAGSDQDEFVDTSSAARGEGRYVLQS
jgi:hypothetical protein